MEPQNTLNLEMERDQEQPFDYSKRAQWLRAAVLGANDGLVSTASLMMGVGAVKQDVKIMILTGFAGLVAGACSMAIGEFVSVYSQYDIEVAQMKRETGGETETEKEKLPSPTQAAAASAFAFSMGATAIVPLLAGAFVKEYKVRLGVIVAAVTLALVMFGWLGAVLGKAPVVKSSLRVLIGGWLAMAITFGFTKLIDIGSHGFKTRCYREQSFVLGTFTVYGLALRIFGIYTLLSLALPPMVFIFCCYRGLSPADRSPAHRSPDDLLDAMERGQQHTL